MTATNLDVRPANNSPALATDPTDQRFVVLANRLDGPRFGCTLSISGNGGRGWLPAIPVPKLPEDAERCYAPEVAFDRDGVLYYLFVGLKGAGNEPVGAFLTSSSDRARSFGPPRRVLGPGNYQVRMAIDPAMGRRGRIHLVWLNTTEPTPTGSLPPAPNPILAAHSDDSGVTFSPPIQVSDPERALAVAPALTLGKDGSVHVGYYDLGHDLRDYQGLDGPTWEGLWSVVVATSADGGEHFGRGVVVDPGVVPPGRVMLIFTMPPPSLATNGEGRLYAAWPDARNGDPDVFSASSPDGGRSWARPSRINDDPAGNKAVQYLPRLSVAPGGRVDAIFYDRRRDPANVQTDVYFTWSVDGGKHYQPNVRLTTESSDSRLGVRYPIVASAKGLVEYGSRLALLSRRDSVLAAWADIRNMRSQDIFTTEVTLPGTGSPPWQRGAAIATGSVIGVLVIVIVAAARRRHSVRRRETPSSSP